MMKFNLYIPYSISLQSELSDIMNVPSFLNPLLNTFIISPEGSITSI
jgi:hypothetical protein